MLTTELMPRVADATRCAVLRRQRTAYAADMPLKHQFHSLEDFLASTMSHIDGVLDDAHGVKVAAAEA